MTMSFPAGESSSASAPAETSWWQFHRLPFLVALLLALATLGATTAIENWMIRERTAARHSTVRETLVAIRARLDATLTANLLVGQGMAAFVAANPALRDDDFYTMARSLLSHRSQVLNIALAQGTRITHVYPLNGNTSVIGIDYRTIPDQWPSIEEVISTGHAVLNGPVQRIQGGIAVIARFPIAIPARNGQGARYWGLVSMPIDFSAMLTKAGIITPLIAGSTTGEERRQGLTLDIALRGHDGNGASGKTFFGSDSVYSRSPETIDLPLPNGSWQIAATPVDGWSPINQDIWTLRATGVAMALLLALTGYLLTRHARVSAHGHKKTASPLDGDVSLLPLTTFFKAAEAEMATSLRYRRAVGFLVIALDCHQEHQKNWTPAQQKDVQARMMAACRNALRPTDLLTETAFGHFAALLIGANRDGAIMAADRVRRAVKAIPSPTNLSSTPLTASIGAAVVRDGDLDATSALNRAAERLRGWQSSHSDGVAL